MAFSNKLAGEGIKFQDYFESVAIENYKPLTTLNITNSTEVDKVFNTFPNSPDKNKIDILCLGLMEICPFYQKNRNK